MFLLLLLVKSSLISGRLTSLVVETGSLDQKDVICILRSQLFQIDRETCHESENRLGRGESVRY